MLRSRIDALTGEINRIQGQVSGADGKQTASATAAAGPLRGQTPRAASVSGGQPDALANVVGHYQELSINQEFAETAYTAALASLDRARSEAVRTQNYLAIYGEPNVAEEAAYPRRWLNIWIVFVLASILWAIGALGVLTIRDHVR